MNSSYIIRKPQITEKSHAAVGDNWYTFVVDASTNKHQIKEVVEAQYKVEVIAVRTMTSPVKTKKTGRRRLKKTLTKSKKAMIQLKKGQSIHLFESVEKTS